MCRYFLLKRKGGLFQCPHSVKGILVNSGIDGNRIKVIGGGVSTRYSTNAENRRAVLIQK